MNNSSEIGMKHIERVSWIDSARGIGIIAVVAGHVFTQPAIKHTIFLFHMPFFFFLSGLLFKAPLNIRTFTRRRVASLITPYVSFLILVTVADFLLGQIDGVTSLSLTPKSVVRLILGGSYLSGAQTVFWFVPCLFFVSMLFANLTRQIGSPAKLVMVAIMAFMYTIAMALPKGVPSPLGIGQAPMALVFFWMGSLVARVQIHTALLIVASCLFGLGTAIDLPMIDMKQMAFGLPIVSAVEALCGTLAIILAARMTEHISPAHRVAAYLGRASLVIMFVHMLIVMHLRSALPESITFIFALVLPAGLHYAFRQSYFTRRFMLGEAVGKV